MLKVYLRWRKEIDFATLNKLNQMRAVKSFEELVELARGELDTNKGLCEEIVETNFEVESGSGEVIYKEKF